MTLRRIVTGVRLTELLRLVDAPSGARVQAEAVKDYLANMPGALCKPWRRTA
jgi:hypothetical protein